MPATDYWRNKLIDFQFRSAALAKPTAWYLAWFTVAPTVAGGGTEVTGGAYARQNLAPGDANWYSTNGALSGNSSGATGLTSNGAAFTFPQPTADWGVINGLALFDAVSSGNMCFYGVLSNDPSVAGYIGFPPFGVYSGEGAVIVPAQALQLLVT